MKNDETLPMYRYTSPIVGRLIAMPTSGGLQSLSKTVGFRQNTVAFDFPAMPDSIELARSAEYYVTTAPVIPDGIHLYKGTKPLEIPFSFKLHSMDRVFCKNGALTLLQMAARLHSFVLPIAPQSGISAIPVTTAIKPDAKTGQADAKGESTQEQMAYDSGFNAPVYRMVGGKGNVTTYPPVTCLLDLIYVGEDQPGISCIGYVRDVRVRLLKPWLRGQNGEYNLPSAAEFEFTFVHRPAHNNSYTMNASNGQYSTSASLSEAQAYATDVRDQLYNTRNLVAQASYIGFNADGAVSSNTAVDSQINNQSQAPVQSAQPVQPVLPSVYNTNA